MTLYIKFQYSYNYYYCIATVASALHPDHSNNYNNDTDILLIAISVDDDGMAINLHPVTSSINYASSRKTRSLIYRKMHVIFPFFSFL